MVGMKILVLGTIFVLTLAGQQPPRKRLLAWADTQTGYQHDSISHALATIERLGRESNAFETFIRTDSQWITKQPVPLPARNTHTLDYFDAIFYYGTGDRSLTDQQKKDLMSFIKVDGKGFIGAHTGDDAFFDWPEFGEIIGGYYRPAEEGPHVVHQSGRQRLHRGAHRGRCVLRLARVRGNDRRVLR
jgi:hypothetical protein